MVKMYRGYNHDEVMKIKHSDIDLEIDLEIAPHDKRHTYENSLRVALPNSLTLLEQPHVAAIPSTRVSRGCNSKHDNYIYKTD